MAELKDQKVKYAICGKGELKEYLEELAEKLGVKEQLFLLGFRTDVIEICKSADVFVFPSKREGLSVALMEAMACGLPCVVSDIRGNRDLIDRRGGKLFCVSDLNELSLFLKKMGDSENLMELGRNNENRILDYDIKKIEALMKVIYLGDC